MESIAANKKYPASKDQISDATDKHNLMKWFDQLSGLMLSLLDQWAWLSESNCSIGIPLAIMLKKTITNRCRLYCLLSIL